MSNDSVSNNLASFDDLFHSGDALPKQPSRSSPGRSGARNDRKSLSAVNRLALLEYPTVPPNIEKMSLQQITDAFSDLRDAHKVDSIGALPRDKLDDRVVSKASKNVASLTTNKMDFFSVGKDGDFLAQVKQMKIDTYDTASSDEFLDALEESMNYIGSAGTMQGLVHRLKTGMLSTPNIRLDRAECVRWARKMIRFKQVDYRYAGLGVTEVIRDLYSKGLVTFNKSSSAGIPYNKSTGAPGVFREALSLSDAILDSIATGKYADFLGKDRKALLGVLLKNKQDYYKIESLTTKVRPYFVYGLHERFMYTALQANLKAVRFDETDQDGPKSSAVGFSWNYGGGDRMYDFVSKNNKPGTFRAIFYGDDQLWVICLHDESVYVVTPDFSHMDLSLVSDWSVVAYDLWKPAFLHLDKTWTAVLKLNCKRAFIRPVVVEGPLTYQFKMGMASGIPGTTKFDEVASATVNGFVEELFTEHSSTISGKADLIQFLKLVKDETKRLFGLSFKEGSLDPYFFEPNQSSYSFIFLGQTLKRMYGKHRPHYVPVPVLSKLVISATTFKKRYKSNSVKQRATMEKLRSLYAGGGIHYPIFGDRLQAYFQLLEKRGITPLDPLDDEELFSSETETNAFFESVFPEGDASWPSYEWCINLYLPHDDQVDEYAGLSRSDHESNPTGENTVEIDLGLDEFDSTGSDEEAPEPVVAIRQNTGGRPPVPKEEYLEKALESSWARAADEERRRMPSGKVVDVGVAEAILLRPVKTAEEMYQIQSKFSPAQKEAYRKAILDERQAKRAERQAATDAARAKALRGKSGPSKGSKRGQSHKGQSIVQALFDEEEPEFEGPDDFSDFE